MILREYPKEKQRKCHAPHCNLRTWDEHQKINDVKVPVSFLKALAGANNWDY